MFNSNIPRVDSLLANIATGVAKVHLTSARLLQLCFSSAVEVAAAATAVPLMSNSNIPLVDS